MLEKAGQIAKIFKFVQRLSNKDYFITGIFGGLAGTLAMDLFNLLSWKRGKTEALYGHIGGSVLTRPILTNRTRNFILGQITHMVTGAGLGLPIMHVLKRYGKKHHLLKGACMGLFSWFWLYTIGQRVHIFAVQPRFSRTHYSGILSNLIYGIATSQAIVSLSPDIFPYTVAYSTSSNSLGKKEERFGTNNSIDNVKEGIQTSFIQ